jgi:hypothetical protein
MELFQWRNYSVIVRRGYNDRPCQSDNHPVNQDTASGLPVLYRWQPTCLSLVDEDPAWGRFQSNPAKENILCLGSTWICQPGVDHDAPRWLCLSSRLGPCLITTDSTPYLPGTFLEPLPSDTDSALSPNPFTFPLIPNWIYTQYTALYTNVCMHRRDQLQLTLSELIGSFLDVSSAKANGRKKVRRLKKRGTSSL